MNETGKIQTLDGFIANEQAAIKWSAVSATGLFVIGIAASGIIYLLTRSSDDLVKFISLIPGLTGTLISSIPAKEYFTKKNRITSCKLFRTAYTSPPVPEEIDKRFWILVDKSLT